MLTLGLDFDSYGLHVCALPDNGDAPIVVTAKLRKKGEGEHQAIQAVGAALASSVRQVNEMHLDRARRSRPEIAEHEKRGIKVTDPVGSAWIERGFGASRRADFVLGAIYGATIAASTSVLPGVAMRPLLAADWKRDVTGECGITTKTGGRGNGNVKKEIANQCAAQIWSAAWPLSIVPTDPNHLDAFSVAWAGQRR